jgi:hypothetical protein
LLCQAKMRSIRLVPPAQSHGWGATKEGGYLADVLQKVTHPFY